jgi:hypothetical protein
MVCECFGLKITWTIFTGLVSKPVATVSGGLSSKPAATVSTGLSSKSVVTVSDGLTSKLAATIFSNLTLKLVATASPGLTSKRPVGFMVELPNQGGGGFSGLCLKIDSSGLVIWALKSPRRFLSLNLKTKRASVCRLCHKTRREVGAGHASRVEI